MSLVTGYAVIRVLQELGIPAKLKWTNDILLERKKTGGILIQNRSGISVAGVGINLVSAPPPTSLRSDHAMAATCLKDTGHPALPLSLWECLVDRSRVIMDEMLVLSAEAAIEQVQAQMAFMGQEVRVDDHTGRAAYRATLMRLSQDGGLILRTGSKIQTIRSGSITPLTDFRKGKT
jgi:BirA family biotin operon repressor/biotin-[acetyl-CoA-carboxylase] ligase